MRQIRDAIRTPAHQKSPGGENKVSAHEENGAEDRTRHDPFGSLVSSASGAAPSHPVNAKIENTIARYRPLPLGAFAGLKEDKLTPPGPGEKNPQVASNTTQPTSRIPRSPMPLRRLPHLDMSQKR